MHRMIGAGAAHMQDLRAAAGPPDAAALAVSPQTGDPDALYL